jgi:hypothetical protein
VRAIADEMELLLAAEDLRKSTFELPSVGRSRLAPLPYFAPCLSPVLGDFSSPISLPLRFKSIQVGRNSARADNVEVEDARSPSDQRLGIRACFANTALYKGLTRNLCQITTITKSGEV